MKKSTPFVTAEFPRKIMSGFAFHPFSVFCFHLQDQEKGRSREGEMKRREYQEKRRSREGKIKRREDQEKRRSREGEIKRREDQEKRSRKRQEANVCC